MDINIPFLGSLRVLECLGAVVDLTQQVVYFSTLDVTAKLKRVGGHLAIEINQFPAQQHRLRVWTQLADKGFDDPEVATTFHLGACRLLQHVGNYGSFSNSITFASDPPRWTSIPS